MPFDNIGTTATAAWLEIDWQQFVPDTGHIAPGTVLLPDGSVIAMMRFPGYPFQLEEVATRNARRVQINELWKNIADSNVVLGIHLTHLHRPSPPVVRGYHDPFVAALFASYRRHLTERVFENTWYLTVMVRPRFAPTRGWRRMIGQKAAPVAANPALVRQHEAIMRAVLAYFGPDGGRRLGYRTDENAVRYSEIGEARRVCLYGRFQPVPVVDGPLGAAIYTERIVCGSRAIRIEGIDGDRYARPLAFGLYPAKSRTGQLAQLLKLDSEFVLAQTFHFASASLSQAAIYFRQTHIANTGLAPKAVAALDDAMEDVRSGEDVRGDHTLSLVVFGADIEAVNAAAADAAAAITKAGASPIQDDKNSFAAFWSGLTGNPEYLQARRADILTANLTAFAEFNGSPAGGSPGPWGQGIVQLRTADNTLFDWQPHVDLLANALFLGISRSGKTLLMNLLLAALDVRVFYFDRDHCAEPLTRAIGGHYLPLRSGVASGLAPVRGLSASPGDQAFLVQWFAAVMQMDGRGPLKSDTPERLARGVRRSMRLPPAKRSIAGIRSMLGFEADGDGQRLDPWCHDGPMGWLFDGPTDLVRTDADWVTVDMTLLLTHPACPAVAAYLMHRNRPRIDGTPFIMACPEARLYLTNPLFADIIEDFSLGLAKKNGALWLDTQEPDHLLKSTVGASLVSQTSNIWQFPTTTADTECYIEKLGFTPAMVHAISAVMPALPFRSVLLKRKDGSAILNVSLNDMADEIALLSGTEATIGLIPEILATVGETDPAAFRRAFIAAVRKQRET